jgi:acyl dehydratase
VPEDARELGFWRLRADAGLDFAKLTGDFNPVHWVPAYARAFGFRNCILHGFATMARAMEGLHRGLLSGDTGRIRTLDVQFTSPLVLPARVGLYVAHGDDGARRVWVGDGRGGRAQLAGTFELRTSNGANMP